MAEVHAFFDNLHFADKDFVRRFGQVVREACAEALTVPKFSATKLDAHLPGNFEVFNHEIKDGDVCDFPIYVSVEFDHHPHRTKKLDDLSVQKMLVEKISGIADCEVGIYFKPVYDGSWIVAMQPLVLGKNPSARTPPHAARRRVVVPTQEQQDADCREMLRKAQIGPHKLD